MTCTQNAKLIQRIIHQFTHKASIHISIHYLTGAFEQSPALALDSDHYVHSCEFCNAAKTTGLGLKLCLKNKNLSIRKAMELKETYIGMCHLGLTEIVKPVFSEDRPICIIYIGHILVDINNAEMVKKIDKTCKVTHMDPALLYERIKAVEVITTNDLHSYIDMVDILASTIRLCLPEAKKNAHKDSSSEKIKTNTVHWLILQVINYIEQYYDADLHLPQIADLYFVNSQYLCRLFSKEMGVNFSDYLNTVRIKNAKILLHENQKSITEISSKVGFNSISYFNYVFKQRVGISPREYRKTSIQ